MMSMFQISNDLQLIVIMVFKSFFAKKTAILYVCIIVMFEIKKF